MVHWVFNFLNLPYSHAKQRGSRFTPILLDVYTAELHEIAERTVAVFHCG